MFYSQWHGQVGIDLKAAIKESMTETTTESKRETSTLSFTWQDEVQLRHKYRGREEQVEKIMKNAESMYCKYREVTLYADPKYCNNETVTSSSSRGRERELSACENARPLKKKKS